MLFLYRINRINRAYLFKKNSKMITMMIHFHHNQNTIIFTTIKIQLIKRIYSKEKIRYKNKQNNAQQMKVKRVINIKRK